MKGKLLENPHYLTRDVMKLAGGCNTHSLNSSWHDVVSRLPNKTAVICGDNHINHAELAERVEVFVASLVEAGVTSGDRVVLLLDNSIEFVVAMLAVFEMHAVLVPVSPLTRPEKCAFILNNTTARVLLTQSSLASVFTDIGKLENTLAIVLADQLLADTKTGRAGSSKTQQIMPVSTADKPAADSLAAILYTSGSTGYPKGVMLSTANMLAAWRSVQAYLNFRVDDVIGLALPVSFSYGLYHLIMGLGLGATIVLERNAVFPVVLLQRWEKYGVTVFPGVPTLFISVLSRNPAQFDLRALRLITNAGAAINESLQRALRENFMQARLYLMYGLTECKRASYLAPEQLDLRIGSVGRGLIGQRHWLVDENGNEVVTGQVGELVVAGEHVMQGYWRQPDETQRALRPAPDGTLALYTGDLFRSDADGYLYFVSRSDDIIMTRGEKVSPCEVEKTICELPGIVDAAVSGVADELLGEAVSAYVVLAEGELYTERAVILHCLARLESYMAPRHVFFVDALPQTDSGKVHRAALENTHPGSL